MNMPGPGRPREVGRQITGLSGGPRFISAFTLVEMLVVIAIILLVAVVALPSITSLGRSSARRNAVSLTMAALDQTRGMAVARSATLYLVFADADAAWSERYRQRAFGIFQETYEPQTETYHRELVGNWTPLPDGIAFKADADTVFKATPEKFYCHPVGREMELPCFKFTETGGIDSPNKVNLSRLRLFEGFIDPGGAPVTTNHANAAAEEVIKVSLQTGRAQREIANEN